MRYRHQKVKNSVRTVSMALMAAFSAMWDGISNSMRLFFRDEQNCLHIILHQFVDGEATRLKF